MFHARRHDQPVLTPKHNHIRLLKAFGALLDRDRRLVLSVLNSGGGGGGGGGTF
jgi:hypothetical protein